jgi:hypothetical protein
MVWEYHDTQGVHRGQNQTFEAKLNNGILQQAVRKTSRHTGLLA